MHMNHWKRVAVLGTSGYMVNQPFTDISRALDVAGANTGNFVFQYAVCKVIGDSAEIVNIALGEEGSENNPLEVIAGCDVVVMPAANHLRADAAWDGFNSFLARIHKPIIVLGLGAQADRSGDVEQTVATLRGNASVQRMCEVLADKASFIGVRGQFSRDVALGMGMKNVEVTGCPSFLISDRETLGRELHDRLDTLRTNPQAARMCMVAETPYNICTSATKLATEQSLFRFIVQNDAPYIQQSGGEPSLWAALGITPAHLEEKIRWLQEYMAPAMATDQLEAFLRKRGRVFFSAPDWIEYLRKFDLCIGHRFHGNMAAVGANRLGVVISHDSRTSELVDFMHIPSISAEAIRAATPTKASILAHVEFNGEGFDHQRRHIARKWLDIFEPLGVGLSPYIRTLAGARADHAGTAA